MQPNSEMTLSSETGSAETESSLIYFEMDARRTTEEGGSYLVVMTD